MRNLILLAAAATLAACNQNAPSGDAQQSEATTGPATAETSQNAAAPDQAEALKALEAANAAYDKALIDGDAKALARIYTDDFQIVDDDGAVHGKQDQIDFMTRKVDLLSATGDDVRVTMLGPDSALVTGRFTGRYRMDGKESDFVERYTSVWVRQNGEWKVRHEHASLLPKKEVAPAAT